MHAPTPLSRYFYKDYNERGEKVRPLRISDHARQKMKLRRITIDEVMEIRQFPQFTDLKGNDRRYYLIDLCIVVAEGRHVDTVKTVLFRVGKRWSDEDVRNR